MNQFIIYIQDTVFNALIIMSPTPECLEKYSIQEIADKDVPSGKPYKIVDENYFPEDKTFMDAWEVDESELTDGVGAKSNEFREIR
jgi:hypothetical protein